MLNYSYKQSVKNMVRHTILKKAVDMLTVNRSTACCVRNSYVRDLYDYFVCLKETHESNEAKKIDLSYIREWERIHMNSIGNKRPDELSVCYLSGPEPENDFQELVNLGVLPQNIWAFENEKNTYLRALGSLDTSSYMQPKIIKASIERFFENTPKTFDIVYIDACASLISDQHALRCVSSLFQHHRLNSPGILITNFACFDVNNSIEKAQYVDLISRYNHIKSNRKFGVRNDSGKIVLSDDIEETYKKTEEHLKDAYGDFITAMICNAASVTIPVLRFCNSTYLNTLSTTTPINGYKFTVENVNQIKDNTVFKYFASNELLQPFDTNYLGVDRINKLSKELSGSFQIEKFLPSLKKVNDIKTDTVNLPEELKEVIHFFDKSKKLYQFLDKPNRVLFIDSVINQLSYPMHYVADKSLRLSYTAKTKQMFTDLILFDECRYIYDWIPAIHQIVKAFSNKSWQYTFRFGLDGLVKQRINYNNEFFFQGSVISKVIPNFEAKHFPERLLVREETDYEY